MTRISVEVSTSENFKVLLAFLLQLIEFEENNYYIAFNKSFPQFYKK